MIVGNRMSKDLITIEQEDSVEKAFYLLQSNNIRHLPVLHKEKLVGIITDRDLRQCLIPHRTGKKRVAVDFQIANVPVKNVMTRHPITVSTETDIEQAGRLLHYHRIDGLPVVDNGKLSGIITITDLLEIFLEFMSILGSSVRIDVVLGETEGAYERACQIIKQRRGKVISVAMSAHKSLKDRIYFFRLETEALESIVNAMEEEGFEVLNAIE